MKEVWLSRGMAASSQREAFRHGLVLANSPRPDLNAPAPSGLFYTRNTTEGYLGFAEQYADENVSEERPVPLTVHFSVTRSNFPLLQDRLHSVEPNLGNEVVPHTFTPITVYEDLRRPTHNMFVDLTGLGSRGLSDLGLYVGVKQNTGYRYMPYAQWVHKLVMPPTNKQATAA